jgi:predicted transcriptional regulator
MITLSKQEERLMAFLWQQKKSYLKDLLAAYPKPKPAKTTLATLVKRLQNKGFIAYELHGNSRAYYALVTKEHYLKTKMEDLIKLYFGGQMSHFIEFISKDLNLESTNLNQLAQVIQKEVRLKQNKEAVFF